MASDSQSSALESLSSALASAPPSEISHGGRRWRAIEHVPNKKKNSKRARAWSFGQEYENVDNSRMRAWRCNFCTQDSLLILSNKQINPANRHLQAKHPAVWKVAAAEGDDEQDERISGLVQKANITDFHMYLMQWIVRHHVAFSMVEDEDFQAMITSCNSGVADYLVQSGSTIRNWVEEEYLWAMTQVEQVLASSYSKIHISFDLWTSPNGIAFCGIVGHFVGQGHNAVSVLLGLKRMKAGHTGEDIAEVILPVLHQYGIINKIGVWVADNADSNDTAIKAILKVIDSRIKDISPYRSRCLGHIINLAAKAFLFGKETDAFEAITELVDDTTPMDSATMREAQAAWHSKGPIGKLHNVVVFVRSSTLRREAFLRVVVGANSDGKLEPRHAHIFGKSSSGAASSEQPKIRRGYARKRFPSQSACSV